MDEPKKEKEPIVTTLLNFFTGGGGYLYIGQSAKGAIFIAAEVIFIIIVCVLMVMMAGVGLGLTPLGALAFCPIILWVIIAIGTAFDGYSLTQRINAGQTLDKWEFFFTHK